ncbi:MAG TPA: hypothetical protein VK150_05240 [Geothrix sp.]|nr:hypothetical protein [Geothrix sp.]
MPKEEAIQEVLRYINATPEMQSILYDIDLLPEQTMKHPGNWMRTCMVVQIYQHAIKQEARVAELGAQLSPLNTCDLADFIGPTKPCPFCGSTALTRDGFEEYIICQNCGGSAPVGGWQFRAIDKP